MKRIIIRSMSVALVLAILCTSAGLMIFKSYRFIILLFASLFFLYSSDSKLVWRLKRIEDSWMRTLFIYVYLVATLVGICLGFCALASVAGLGMGEFITTFPSIDINALKSLTGQTLSEPFSLGWVLYSIMFTIFSFRYFVIVVRVMARHMDWKLEC